MQKHIKNIVNTGTITYALRGRDALRSYGFSAYMQRISGKAGIGCGYAVITTCDETTIRKIFDKMGIKYISIVSNDAQ